MPVLHYRKDARVRKEGNYYIKCRKDGGFQTWQLTPKGASLLIRIGKSSDDDVSWDTLKVLIENDLAYLHDPQGAQERWRQKVAAETTIDPVAANAKYGDVLKWLESQKNKKPDSN